MGGPCDPWAPREDRQLGLGLRWEERGQHHCRGEGRDRDQQQKTWSWQGTRWVGEVKDEKAGQGIGVGEHVDTRPKT